MLSEDPWLKHALYSCAGCSQPCQPVPLGGSGRHVATSTDAAGGTWYHIASGTSILHVQGTFPVRLLQQPCRRSTCCSSKAWIPIRNALTCMAAITTDCCSICTTIGQCWLVLAKPAPACEAHDLFPALDLLNSPRRLTPKLQPRAAAPSAPDHAPRRIPAFQPFWTT